MTPDQINVLVACEESQAVCLAFRARGFNAYSCDIQECSGGHPEYHIQGDALIAVRVHSLRCTPMDKIINRTLERIEAMRFFMFFAALPCRVAIENPVGVMSSVYRKPDQTIHPYMFARSEEDPDYVTKATCLWLDGMPPLVGNDLPRPNNHDIYGTFPSGKAKTWEDQVSRAGGSSKSRSKTFTSIAQAMADQWGDYLLEVYNIEEAMTNG